MGTLRRRRQAPSNVLPAVEVDRHNTDNRPKATITSWNGPPEIELTAFFARSSSRAFASGHSPLTAEALLRSAEDLHTVCLSDGTEITFSTAGGREPVNRFNIFG